MKRHLRLPAALSVVVLSAGVGAVLGCGDGASRPDASNDASSSDGPRADARVIDAAVIDGVPADAECVSYCFPDGTGTGDECPFPTCATGPAHDLCPDHCTTAI